MSYLAKIFGMGMLLGVVLFFTFAYFGWIDRLITWLNKQSN
ncbi:hypothetical protein GALL_198290 [mine drainage metagenome]|uniref:Uncharacterized protein n=1 Tax=mine drainage metagenome TaxID=410659 RepID=A0A1J5RQS6_9ZZZZ